MLRTAKIMLVLTVALWAFLGAFGNITDWDGILASVETVTSKTLFEGGASTWQATSNPIVIWIGALLITLSKLIGGAMCAIGGLKMWGARSSDAMTFASAKELALTGFIVLVIMLFGGFIVIAETWFELWRSYEMGGMILGTAFRYGAMITLIAIFVGMKEGENQ